MYIVAASVKRGNNDQTQRLCIAASDSLSTAFEYGLPERTLSPQAFVFSPPDSDGSNARALVVTSRGKLVKKLICPGLWV